MIFRKQALDDKSLPSSILTTHKGPVNTVAYRKTDHVTYFDSFGNLRPPSELIEYLGAGVSIQYNYEAYQDFNSYHCCHLCLRFIQGDL